LIKAVEEKPLSKTLLLLFVYQGYSN